MKILVSLFLWCCLAVLCCQAEVAPPTALYELARTQNAVPTLTEIQQLAQNSATRVQYPDADSCLLWDSTVCIYEKSGLSQEYSHSFTKILTEKGLRENRQISLGFNAAYSKLNFHHLAIHHPDGQIEVLDAAKLSKVAIAPGQMGQNIYDPQQKVLRVAIPKLNIGDIVEASWSRQIIKARIPGMWSNYLMLQYDMPILRSVIVVNAPAELPLKKFAVKAEIPGNPVKFTQKSASQRLLYRWEAKNAPQIIPEPGMPELFSCARRLLLSTSPNWASVAKWYAQLCRPALDAVDPELKAQVKKLIAGKMSDREKVRALFLFVSQQIRYLGLTTEKEAPGYEPHPVKMTFHNRYGVCRDKAALLAAMLEQAGFKAYPTLIMVGDPKDDEVPNEYFNHAVVAWESRPGHYELLDPTYESTTEFFPAFQMNMSYLVAKPTGERLLRTPIIPPEKNSMDITTQAQFDFTGQLTGHCTLNFGGVNDLFYRNAFSVWTSELKKQFFNLQLRKNFPGAEITQLEISPRNIRDMNQKLQAKFAFKVPAMLPANSRAFLLPLPQLGQYFGALSYVFAELNLTQRHFPLKFDSTCQVNESFELTLPESIELLALPRNRKFELPGAFSKAWQLKHTSTSRQGGKLTGVRKTALKTLQITPSQYLQLKQLDAQAQSAQQELPVGRTNFASVPPAQLSSLFAETDSLLLKTATEFKLISAHEAIMTTASRRKILNYAGVKKYSELKVPYNPALCQVKISAEVIRKNGKIQRLVPTEINHMDAAWNAQAPRYPGSKILVASLPGVEPGATIKTRIEMHYLNMPFFALNVPLAGFCPAAERQFTLDAPATLRLSISELPGGVNYSETHTPDHLRVIRRWQVKDTPRIKREIGMAPLWYFAPALQISAGNYGRYSKQIAAQLRDRSSATRAVKKFVADRKWAELGTEEKKIEAVRYYIDKFIRPAGPAWGEIPLNALANQPEITLKSGYGNSADRALLTAAMLNALGIEHRFVLAGDLGYAPRLFKLLSDTPQENVFTKLLIFLPKHNYYLNDSSRYAPLGSGESEGKISLDLQSGRLQPIQVRLRRESDDRTNYKIICHADDSALITVTRELYGNNFAQLNQQLQNFTPELRKRYFDRCAWAISPEAVIKNSPEIDFDSYPGRLTFTVNVPNFIARSGRYGSFELPGFHRFGQAVQNAGRDRTTPIWRNQSQRFRINYQIQLPPGAQVAPGHPERRELGRYGSTNYQESFYAEGNLLRLDSRITLPVELISASGCGELADIQQVLNALNVRKILLKLKPANVGVAR